MTTYVVWILLIFAHAAGQPPVAVIDGLASQQACQSVAATVHANQPSVGWACIETRKVTPLVFNKP